VFFLAATLARAATLIYPVEAIDDLWQLPADDFRQKYAGINISGIGPSDEGWYVRYKHENLTYLFGPLADSEAARKKKWELEAVRDAAIRNRPTLTSSKVDYVKFTYSSVFGKGGGDGSGAGGSRMSKDGKSGPDGALDGDGKGVIAKDGSGDGQGDGAGGEGKDGKGGKGGKDGQMAGLDGQGGDGAGGDQAGGQDGKGGKKGGKGSKSVGVGDGSDGSEGGGQQGGAPKVASAKGGKSGSAGGQQGGQSGQSGQQAGQAGSQGSSGGQSGGQQGQGGSPGGPSGGGQGGGGNPLQLIGALLRAILGL
jgi:hypothetical protein